MSLEPIRISHPRLVKPIAIKTQGIFEEKKNEIISFLDEKEKSELTHLIFELDGSNNHFNRIEIHPLSGENDFFPDIFRIEMSQDGKYWEPIIQESGFRRSQKTVASWNFSLTSARYIKFIAKINRRTDAGRYRIAFGQFRILISGVVKIQASSEADRLSVKENLIDERPDYGWSSLPKAEPTEEFLLFDLSAIHRVEEIRMLSKQNETTNFPEKFTVFYSEDDLAWHQLMEEPNFLAEPGTWYRWRFLPVNARYLKIIANQQAVAGVSSYVTEIVEVEFFASPDKGDSEKGGKSSEPLPYASVLRSGMVRLGVDGENRDGVAVQGSDRRLREATTEYKGIVELATDGENREGVVVQGSDKRLKEASELAHGLTRLARSGENRAGVVVQGNDERLKAASTENPGIVELAADGETRPGVVVQGSDKRLRKATKSEYGLVILAEDNDTTPDRVVSGSDPRLRDATTEAKGIVKLASSGEENPLSVVQGNDKRLKKATTEAHGIVQLARSGENKAEAVVQGNDKRLERASFDNAGITLLARHGIADPEKVVISDDPRLSDARNPLPHKHDYASKDHDFNSHTGLIQITGKVASGANGIFPPNPNHSVIYGKNEDPQGAGISAVGGKEGIIGYADGTGVAGYSVGEKNSQGVLGASKQGIGGMFISQSNYAIHANGKGIQEKSLSGSGKAVLASGDSLFEGVLQIDSKQDFHCMGKVFSLDTRDVIGQGDLLVVSEDGTKLGKSKNPYSTNVVGVLVKKLSILLGKDKTDKDEGLVALTGIVPLNVDPSMGAIRPGDLLVAGLTGGYAIKADPNRLKPGSIVAKALESSQKEKGSILVLLTIA
ncbi:MAG: discoidin domain-containing protein [Leptospira sp.]|nr:discoidin domain-containing protein [Leptospira sp.]